MPDSALWPAAQGPVANGCAAIPSGVATIDDIAALRPIWRCEEFDIGHGMGNTSRQMQSWGSANRIRTMSGCSGALLANGRIYAKYYVPASGADKEGTVHPSPSHKATEAVLLGKLQAEAKAAGVDPVPIRALEKIATAIDDILLCMDAATGKTIWKTVVPDRRGNYQHHKFGPFDLTPAYADGRVFTLSNEGQLAAFDAATGKPLWEVASVYDDSNALLAVAGVVVAPAGKGWGGYDAATGKLRWTAGSRWVSMLTAWPHQGKTYLIGAMSAAAVACLDAETGKEVWNRPIAIVTSGRGLGPGGITISGDTLVAYEKRDGEASLTAYRLTAGGPEPLWQLGRAQAGGAAPAKGGDNSDKSDKEDGEDGDGSWKGSPTHGESVPVVVHGAYVFAADLRVVDLATGKVVSQAEGPRTNNGGYMQVMDDIVLVRVDGSHGSALPCAWYKVGKDGSVRNLSGPEHWLPPIGGSTSSYHHPLYYPLGAGRIFLRQDDGIYCWDLRAGGR